MIITSGLLEPISKLFYWLGKGDLIPIVPPYRLDITSDQSSKPFLEFKINPKYGKFYLFQLSILYICAIFMGMYRLQFEMTRQGDLFMCRWTVGFLLFGLLLGWFCHKHGNTVTYFFNQLVKFESRYVHDAGKYLKIKRRRLMRVLVLGLTAIMFSNGFFFAISAAVSPAVPWSVVPVGIYGNVDLLNLYYGGPDFLDALLEMLKRFVGTLFTFTVWRHCGKMGMLTCTLSMLTGTFALNAALLQFNWMLRSCGNGTRDFIKFAYAFREIQLMCRIYNKVHANTVFQWYVVAMPLSLAMCLYILVTDGKSATIQMLIQFTNLLVAMTAITIFVFGSAAALYTTSTYMKASMSRGELVKFLTGRHAGHYSKYVARFWKSMPVLKICFFSSNFFDKKTPLVFLDFGIAMAINLILLKSK